jgi:hypothetical protein
MHNADGGDDRDGKRPYCLDWQSFGFHIALPDLPVSLNQLDKYYRIPRAGPDDTAGSRLPPERGFGRQ